jgi:hypothetical protein
MRQSRPSSQTPRDRHDNRSVDRRAARDVLRDGPGFDGRDPPASPHDAASAWRLTPASELAQALRRLGASLRDRGEELAVTATSEMGKPLTDSRAEADKCAWACDWFAEHGPALLVSETRYGSSRI